MSRTPMFKIKDCDEVILENNHTSSDMMLEYENVKKVILKHNTCGAVKRKTLYQKVCEYFNRLFT